MKIELNRKKFDIVRKMHEFDILANGRIVGLVQLRLTPSKSEDMPAGFENNIYYEVDDTHRNKGVASEALRLTLQEAKKHGLKKVIIATNWDNKPSIRVIEKAGGQLVKTGKTNQGGLVLKFSVKS